MLSYLPAIPSNIQEEKSLGKFVGCDAPACFRSRQCRSRQRRERAPLAYAARHVTCCLKRLPIQRKQNNASRCNVTRLCHSELQALVMNFITKPLYNHAKLFMLLSFALAIILTGIFLRLNNNTAETDVTQDVEYDSMINANGTEPRKTRRKEYLYRLLTNTTRSLIQMEIKARRLEENMRRIKEKTADLLWKNKDKALWHILFKNISRHISIRHEFHQHASLRRIMQDSHGHVHNRRRKVFLSR